MRIIPPGISQLGGDPVEMIQDQSEVRSHRNRLQFWLPGIFEGGAGGLATDRSSVVAVRIEGRIEIDEIDAIAIHFPHDVEVVTDEDCFVFPVHFGSSLTMIKSFRRTRRAICTTETASLARTIWGSSVAIGGVDTLPGVHSP